VAVYFAGFFVLFFSTGFNCFCIIVIKIKLINFISALNNQAKQEEKKQKITYTKKITITKRLKKKKLESV
jgi:hypothetical protein